MNLEDFLFKIRIDVDNKKLISNKRMRKLMEIVELYQNGFTLIGFECPYTKKPCEFSHNALNRAQQLTRFYIEIGTDKENHPIEETCDECGLLLTTLGCLPGHCKYMRKMGR